MYILKEWGYKCECCGGILVQGSIVMPIYYDEGDETVGMPGGIDFVCSDCIMDAAREALNADLVEKEQ